MCLRKIPYERFGFEYEWFGSVPGRRPVLGLGSVLFRLDKQMAPVKKIIAFCFLFSQGTAALADTTFRLTSPEIRQHHFENNHLSSAVFGLGCTGGNHSPALQWENIPAGTRSFTLEIFDEDAPTGHGWVHWEIVNIPADVHTLAAGILADNTGLPSPAFQTRTDFGVPGYGGACPPAGQTHHYVITLKALTVAKLPGVTANATPALVGYLANQNAIATARLEVTQSR